MMQRDSRLSRWSDRLRRRDLPRLSGLAGSLALLAGCTGFEGSSGSPSQQQPPPASNTPSKPAPPSGSPSPSPAPAPPPSHAGYGNIPDSAERVVSGTGKQEFRVPRTGTLWVGNDSRGYAILRRSVHRNDRVEVIPDRDRVELNEQPIYTENLERSDTHSIYFRERVSSSGEWSDGPGPYGDIPRDAENVASSTGRVSWHADGNGQIWVGDDKTQKTVVTQRVKKGDLVEISFDPDQVKLNGRIVFSQNLESKHRHSVFFR